MFLLVEVRYRGLAGQSLSRDFAALGIMGKEKEESHLEEYGGCRERLKLAMWGV